MKKIFILLLVFALLGCNKQQQKAKNDQDLVEENRVLSVAEAHIEKQIAELKFCEAIFETELFNLYEQEKLIHGKECYLMWTASEESILNTSKRHPEASKKLLEYTIASRNKANNKQWINKAKVLYEEITLKEGYYLVMSEACQILLVAGDYNYNEKAVDDCIEYSKEKYLFEKSFSLVF